MVRTSNVFEKAWSWLSSRFTQKGGDYSQWEENTSSVKQTPNTGQQLASELDTQKPSSEELDKVSKQIQSGQVSDVYLKSKNSNNDWKQQVKQQSIIKSAEEDIQLAQKQTTAPEVPENVKNIITQQQQTKKFEDYINRRENIVKEQNVGTKQNYKDFSKGLIQGAFYAPYDAYREIMGVIGSSFSKGKETSPAKQELILSLSKKMPNSTNIYDIENIGYEVFMNKYSPDVPREYYISEYDELGQPIKSPIIDSTSKDMIESLVKGNDDASKAFGYAISSFVIQNIIGDWLVSKALPTATIKKTDVQSFVIDIQPDVSWKKITNIDDSGMLSIDFYPVEQSLIPQSSSIATTFVEYGDEVLEIKGFSKTSFVGKNKITSGISDVFSETITSPEYIGKGVSLYEPGYQLDISTVLKTFDKDVSIIETMSYSKYPYINIQKSETIARLAFKGKNGYGDIYTLTGKSGDNVFSGMTGIYSKSKIKNFKQIEVITDLKPSETPIFKRIISEDKISEIVSEPITASKTMSVEQGLSSISSKSAAQTSIKKAQVFVQQTEKTQFQVKSLISGMIASKTNVLVDEYPKIPKTDNVNEIVQSMKYGEGVIDFTDNAINLKINQVSKIKTKEKIKEKNDSDIKSDVKSDVIIDIKSDEKTSTMIKSIQNNIPKQTISKVPTFPYIKTQKINNPFSLNIQINKKLKNNLYNPIKFLKRENNYTPSFSAVVTGNKSKKLPTSKEWTGLELRPMIINKKEKNKWKKLSLFKNK